MTQFCRRFWPIALALVGVAAVGGRAHATQRIAEQEIVWPQPPEEPRIRYVGLLASDRDLGKKRSFFGRIAGGLVGSHDDVTTVQRPHDVYVDDSGLMFVTNGLESGFWIFDPGEKEARLVRPVGAASVGKPMGIDGDNDGVLFVADSRSRRVVAMDAEGNYLAAYGGESVMLNPVDVAISPSGDRVYVADSYLHQILIYDRDGTLVRRIGRDDGNLAEKDLRSRQTPETPGHGEDWSADPSDLFENRSAEPGEFRYPAFVAVGPTGLVYVSDGLNFRVQIFDRDGEYISQFGRLGDTPGSFARPKGIAVDGDGHVYVVDGAFNNVQVFDSSGTLLMAFGGFGVEAGGLWLPLGIGIDANNRIFVADRYNNRLQIYQYLGDAEVESEMDGTS